MNPQSDCHRWGSALLGQTFDPKKTYPILMLPPGNYIDPIGLGMLVSQIQKNMWHHLHPLVCVFPVTTKDSTPFTKKTKSANAKLLRMDLLQWLWLFCEFLAKLQSCYQRHLTVFPTMGPRAPWKSWRRQRCWMGGKEWKGFLDTTRRMNTGEVLQYPPWN